MQNMSTRSKRTAASPTAGRGRTGGGDELVAPDLQRATALVLELMAIPGKSGEEGDVADVIERKLLDAGATPSMMRRDGVHRRTPIKGDTGNLIVKLPGTFRGPRRMFSAHMDTVPICVGCRPKIRKRMVRSSDPNTGLGADDRAGVATTLSAALEVLERDLPHPPLTFCWFIQEEIGLHGSRLVSTKSLGNPQLAFNWDGGAAGKLTVGATGGCRIAIEVTGVASHAGVAPEWGVSAIVIASRAIADLHDNGWLGSVRRGGKEGTSNVGVIRGGDATNVVTDRVLLRAEARSHNQAFRERIVAEIKKAFEKAARTTKNVAGAKGSIKFQPRTDYEAFLLDDDESCVVAAEAAVTAVGRDPVRAVANGGVDANWTTRHGIPTVTLGCGQMNPHMVTEALDLDGYEDACRIALLLATGFPERAVEGAP
jgi:tripeptide aminopeptidase